MPSPDAAAPGRLCPPPLQHRLRECGPKAIPLRRSFLRYRPSAPPDPRAYRLTLRYGAAKMNRWRGSAPPPCPARGAPTTVVTPSAATAHQKFGGHHSASGDNWGGFALAALVMASSLPLAPAHLARSLEGGGKGARFPATKLAATDAYASVPQANQRFAPSQTQYAPARGHLRSRDLASCSREDIAK
jgi:hypothetical protein